MAMQLLVASVMVVMTVLFHGWGLTHLVAFTNRMSASEVTPSDVAHFSRRWTGFATAAAFGLLVLHSAEVWFYAAFYWLVGGVKDLETAVYFSSITYAAIGFSDAEITRPWRLVAAIEGINGIILIGWSTAFLVTVMTPRRID